MKTIKTIFEVGDTVRVMTFDKDIQQNIFVARACVQTVNTDGDRITILITRTIGGYFYQDETYILRAFQGDDIWTIPTIDPGGKECHSGIARSFYLEITEP